VVRGLGTKTQGGTRMYSSRAGRAPGRVRDVGRITLRQLIYDRAGGVTGMAAEAVVPGGSSAAFSPRTRSTSRWTSTAQERRHHGGLAGVIVMDETVRSRGAHGGGALLTLTELRPVHAVPRVDGLDLQDDRGSSSGAARRTISTRFSTWPSAAPGRRSAPSTTARSPVYLLHREVPAEFEALIPHA